MRGGQTRRLGRHIGWTVLVAASAATLAVGTVLDWSTQRVGDRAIAHTGLTSGGGGDVVAILAVIVLVATTTRFSMRTRRVLGPLAVGVGLIGTLVALLEVATLIYPIPDATGGVSTIVGPGVWVTMLAAVAETAAGIGLYLSDRRASAQSARVVRTTRSRP